MAEPRKFPRTILAALMMAAELIATHPVVASSSPIEDRWLTDDRKAVVLIASCGAALCGTIRQIRDKGPDVPKTDVYNPVPVLRSRSLIGCPSFSDSDRMAAIGPMGMPMTQKVARHTARACTWRHTINSSLPAVSSSFASLNIGRGWRPIENDDDLPAA